jgi:hypothetical protein
MTDKDMIQQAYEDKLGNLYEQLFNGLLAAQADPAQVAAAEGRFSQGVALARRTRDRAMALVDPITMPS